MSDTQRQRVTLLGTRSLEPRCVATSLDLNLCDALCYFPDQFVKLALELVNLILQIIYLSLNTGHFSPCADANGLLWKSARAFLVFSRAYAPSCISSFGCVAGSLPLRAASIAAMFRFISSSLSFSMRARVLPLRNARVFQPSAQRSYHSPHDLSSNVAWRFALSFLLRALISCRLSLSNSWLASKIAVVLKIRI